MAGSVSVLSILGDAVCGIQSNGPSGGAAARRPVDPDAILTELRTRGDLTRLAAGE